MSKSTQSSWNFLEWKQILSQESSNWATKTCKLFSNNQSFWQKTPKLVRSSFQNLRSSILVEWKFPKLARNSFDNPGAELVSLGVSWNIKASSKAVWINVQNYQESQKLCEICLRRHFFNNMSQKAVVGIPFFWCQKTIDKDLSNSKKNVWFSWIIIATRQNSKKEATDLNHCLTNRQEKKSLCSKKKLKKVLWSLNPLRKDVFLECKSQNTAEWDLSNSEQNSLVLNI